MKGLFKLICAVLALASILAGVGIGASASEAEVGTESVFGVTADLDMTDEPDLGSYITAVEPDAELGFEVTEADVGAEPDVGEDDFVSEGETDGEGNAEDVATDNDNAGQKVDKGDENDSNFLDTGDENGIEKTDTGDENIFAAIYSFASERSAEIFALLSFIGSLIIVVCYKSGILPLLREGLGGMLGAVGKLKEGVAESERLSKETSEALSTRLGEAEYMIGGFSERVAAIEAACELTAKRTAETSDLKELITLEIDLLHDVFMTAALPQYLKESIGERVGEMKKRLGASVSGEALPGGGKTEAEGAGENA